MVQVVTCWSKFGSTMAILSSWFWIPELANIIDYRVLNIYWLATNIIGVFDLKRSKPINKTCAKVCGLLKSGATSYYPSCLIPFVWGKPMAISCSHGPKTPKSLLRHGTRWFASPPWNVGPWCAHERPLQTVANQPSHSWCFSEKPCRILV